MGAYSGFLFPKWTSFGTTYGRPVTSFQDTTTAEWSAESYPDWYLGVLLFTPSVITAEVSEALAVNASVRTDIPVLPVDYQIAASSFSASATIFVSVVEGIGISDAANKTWIEINSPSNPAWTTIEASSVGSSWTLINTPDSPSSPSWTLIETP
jgi:hypothetical protein